MSNQGRKPKLTLKTLDERQRRTNVEHEHEKISDTEWLAKTAEIDEEKAVLSAQRSEPLFVRQRTMPSSLVEDWQFLEVAERKAIVGKGVRADHRERRRASRVRPRVKPGRTTCERLEATLDP